jgi:hypothetical protein
MKKQLIAAVLAASTFALPVFAHGNDEGKKGPNEHGMGHGLKLGVFKNVLGNFADTQFIVNGTVNSVGTGTFIVKATATAHVSTITNGLVTIKTDSSTKFSTPVATGQNVVVMGNISGTDLLATNVKVLGAEVKKVEKQAAVGKVTAKTADSITITNTLTNTTKTITTDADTKVKIDGEVKTIADINVGDSGWIRFKTVGTSMIAKAIHLFR